MKVGSDGSIDCYVWTVCNNKVIYQILSIIVKENIRSLKRK